jgi:flagellum-specific peptidoglycan hydrolase FlgJ
MKIKQTTVICLSAIMLTSFVKMPIALADNGSQLKSQIQKIEKKRRTTLDDLQNKKAVLNANKNKQEDILSQVQGLESQIQASDYKIQVKQNSIKTTQQNIQTLKNNITMLQNRIKQRKSLIAERARVAYKNGGSITYLQILLDADNFYDLINRIFCVHKIAEEDHSILKQQVTDKQNLEASQQALKQTLDKLNNDVLLIKQMKASLAAKKVKEQTLLKQLKDKANIIQLAMTTKEKQAAIYKQQEIVDRKKLLSWEREQGIKYGSQIPSVCQIFIAPAQALEKTTGIPAAITLAQIILESGGGGHLSELATAGKNLFGIKGEGPAGTIYLTTHEVIGGENITVEAGFKKYDSYYQSMADHAKILNESRYQYFLKNAHSLKEYAQGIKDGGYSTDPQYAAKLLDIIQAYGLAQYDTGSF